MFSTIKRIGLISSHLSVDASRRLHSSLSIPSLDLFRRAVTHGEHVALESNMGSVSYRQLLYGANSLSAVLSDRDMNEGRVAFMCPPDHTYPIAQWGIWHAGGVAVPLHPPLPPAALAHSITDSEAEVCVVHPAFEHALAAALQAAGRPDIRVVTMEADPPVMVSGDVVTEEFELDPARRALIIYTSGTTGKPKGVVSSHANLQAQITDLISTWGWTSSDRILHFLPLHHVHGVVNKLLCALWAGATVEFLPSGGGSTAADIWARLGSGGPQISLLMAVPTIYALLLKEYRSMTPAQQQAARVSCEQLRLCVSGSAAIPQPVAEAWRAASGHTVLERYGMTEMAMCLSQSLDQSQRFLGYVGEPLPSVSVRLVEAETGREVADGEQGELRVKGANVFVQYHNLPDKTAAEFDEQGWFKTGDIAQYDVGKGYRICGRASVDIIKSGGYKLSALEIERYLLGHPAIAEIAVCGVEDEVWGQRVGAVVVPHKGQEELTLDDICYWGREIMASYKLPTLIRVVDAIPKNAMGKVNKKELVKIFDSVPSWS